jgi:hypothetical protein
MRACLQTDADTLRAMGDAARAQAIRRHSVATEAAKLLKHFGERSA